MKSPKPDGLRMETPSLTSSKLHRADTKASGPDACFEGYLAASGTYFHVLDCRTDRYRYVSPGLHRLLGYRPERWRFEGPRALLRAVHPHDREFVREARRTCRSTLQEVSANCRSGLTFSFAARMLRHNGSERLLNHHLTFPEVLPTGEPVLMITTLGDVSFLPRPGAGLVHVTLNGDGGQQHYRTLQLRQVPETGFSRREQEVLGLVAQGMSSREIAARLHVTYHTINTHRKNLLRKAGVTCTVDLLRFARRVGVVD